MDLRDKRVLILGLGETGLAVAKWCVRQGARVRVADSRAPKAAAAAGVLDHALAQLMMFAPDADVYIDFPLTESGAELDAAQQVWLNALLKEIDLLVISPGVSPGRYPGAHIVHAAQALQIPIVGEIELFAWALNDLAKTHDYHPRLIAITGTNGKTTVTQLTGHLIAKAGKHVAIAGNISPAALDALMQALDTAALHSGASDTTVSDKAETPATQLLVTLNLPEVWVLELSSFQLATTYSLKPDAAVVLNLSQDHLDWHGSMQEYADAKARIYQQARICVINRDDPATLAMLQSCLVKQQAALEVDAPETKHKRRSKNPVSNCVPTHDSSSLYDLKMVRSFGSDAPVLAGDMGFDLQQGVNWLATAELGESEEPTGRHKKNLSDMQRPVGYLQHLMPTDALRIRGRHNGLNAQAALLLARSLYPSYPKIPACERSCGRFAALQSLDGVNDPSTFCALHCIPKSSCANPVPSGTKGTKLSWAPLLHGLRTYQGEPHRVQCLRTIREVSYIEDSKGTNVGATVAALQGLGQKIVLIAGGIGKGQDFNLLAPAVAKHARAVVLIGRDADLIEAALAPTGVPCHHASNLSAAVDQASQLAQPGDAVLLSPACASFDMFDNYEHRARLFAQLVDQLALNQGELV